MKRVDITSKLELDKNAVLVIAEEELEVKTDVKTVLLLIAKADEGIDSRNIADVCDLIFTEEAKLRLDNMDLSFKDYATVLHAAMDVVMGKEYETQGEEPTHTTA